MSRRRDVGDKSGQQGKVARRQFAASFGKQAQKMNLDREAAEAQRRHMKHVSERKAAVPMHRLLKP
jgi:hypothetical protein